MRLWPYAFVLTLLTACSHSRLHTPNQELNDPSTHQFKDRYLQLLKKPTVSGLGQLREYIASPKGKTDKYLIAYRSQKQFSDFFFSQIVSQISQGDIITIRSLFYLAFDLGEENIDAESRSISSEIINSERGKNLRTVKSAEYLLSVHVAFNFPQQLIKALAQESYVNQKRTEFYIKQIAEYGINDEPFRALCPNCPANPVDFLEQKYRRLISPQARESDEIKIQESFQKSRLEKINEPPLLQLRKLVFDPQEQSLKSLRDACYVKSNPDALKPTVHDLEDTTLQKIMDLLNKGNLYISQAMIMITNEHCWEDIDPMDGPKPWLANLLLCRQPQIFLQAAALENPKGLFFDEIMNFQSPQSLISCTGQPAAEGNITQIRLERLQSVEAITQSEKKILTYIQSHYDPSSAEKESSNEKKAP